jgi:hypothetical protein
MVAVLYMVVLAVVQVVRLVVEVVCLPLQVVAQIDIVSEAVRLVVV